MSLRPTADLAETDRRLMRATIAYARRNLGRTWPNPSVGALVVRFDGDLPRVVARGVTEAGGRGKPHAERIALAAAGQAARGATLYVTLEPCSHYGTTPPCVEAIIAAGISRVVVAEGDPDSRVAGRGVKILRDAGVEVKTAVLADTAEPGLAGHFTRMRRGRPEVTLKLAVSADGAIGRTDAGRVAISGPEAKGRVHIMRAEHDAIVVGIGTALADDPELTVRLPGMAHRSPVRILFDSRARLPLDSKLVVSAREVPVWLVGGEAAPRHRIDALRGAGVDVLPVPMGPDGRIDPRHALASLAWKGITSVLVEGGAALGQELLNLDLVDELAVFRSPVVIGERRVAAPAAVTAILAGDVGRFEWIASHRVGADRLQQFRRRLY
ncbi:MAG: bifunctional diaminohydroxyphosphoribosylaminopyrimidine deaminase/5-amino-6-(5-phosphoribosylamino)uracil reductase RibD [Ancalomicrobiaceae bacterium]|nr:bifunctional diaminohydroxyphosphoribosylaminopyrimidine deaminase/5-amino-6-(5-phosphoribosylamino)uracil reductase RibD [Ancalomicrobiaceae bacterium]